MEYGLGQKRKQQDNLENNKVLILVLMEYGLGPLFYAAMVELGRRLNPCFNGIWSRTPVKELIGDAEYVLILVVMEYGLGLLLI